MSRPEPRAIQRRSPFAVSCVATPHDPRGDRCGPVRTRADAPLRAQEDQTHAAVRVSGAARCVSTTDRFPTSASCFRSRDVPALQRYRSRRDAAFRCRVRSKASQPLALRPQHGTDPSGAAQPSPLGAINSRVTLSSGHTRYGTVRRYAAMPASAQRRDCTPHRPPR